MKKKVLFTVLTASLMCAAAAVTFAACGGEEKTYTVGYQAKGLSGETGGVPTDETKYKKGEEVTVKGNEGNLAVDGYTFVGWDYDGKTYTEGQKITMPAKNIMLTASYNPISSCTLTYDLDEGNWTYPEEAPETSVAKGTEITLPEMYAVTKSGMELTGWTIGEETLDPGATYTVTGDVTITANWDVEKFSVSYMGGLLGPSEDGGRYVANTEIDVEDLPAEWASATKVFQGWEYTISAEEGDEGAVKNENDEWVITKIYQPGDKFTVPAGNVTLRAKWNHVGIYVNFTLDKESSEPVQVLYKPADLAKPTQAELDAFEAEIPDTTSVTVPAGMSFSWLYDQTYTENDVTYTEHVICDLGTSTIAMLTQAIQAGTEEVDVYGFVGKVVPNFTSTGWWVPGTDTVNISYGQTVTLTGDMLTTAKGENGAHMDYEGIFLSVGKVDSANPVSVLMVYNKNVLNNNNTDNNTSEPTHRVLGVKSATAATLYEFSWDTFDYAPIAYSAATVASMLGGIIGNYTVVVDYTSATQIVVTTSFTSMTEDGGDYKYVGVLTLTAADAHAGLAQTYKLAVCGEGGSSLKNGLFTIAGEEGTLPTIPGHDWTVDNDYKCTICGQINDQHEHAYVEEVCKYCGAVDTVNHTIHRYGENGGFCTVCGEAYQTTVGGTTYTGELEAVTPFENHDPDLTWFNGGTDDVNVSGDFILKIEWDNINDTGFGYDAVLEGHIGTDYLDVNCMNVGDATACRGGLVDGVAGLEWNGTSVGTEPAGEWGGHYVCVATRVGSTLTVVTSFTANGSNSVTYSVTFTITGFTTEGMPIKIHGNPAGLSNFTAAYGTLAAE